MNAARSSPPSLVGTAVDTVTFVVERGKIREFARASHATDAAHLDPEAAAGRGFPDVLATPTHVVVSGHHRDQRGFVDRLGLDITRIVVGSTAWTYSRPLVAGDVLTGSRTVVADETKPGSGTGQLRLVTLETTYLDASGAEAVRQREVLIERSAG